LWIGKEAEDALKFFEEHPNESILAIEIIKAYVLIRSRLRKFLDIWSKQKKNKI